MSSLDGLHQKGCLVCCMALMVIQAKMVKRVLDKGEVELFCGRTYTPNSIE